MHLECNSKINWWATFFYGYYFVLQRSLVFNDHSKYRCKKRAAKKEQERQWLHHKRRVILSISHVWTLQVVIFGGLSVYYICILERIHAKDPYWCCKARSLPEVDTEQVTASQHFLKTGCQHESDTKCTFSRQTIIKDRLA